MRLKQLVLAGSALSLLALAACGSSGGGSPSTGIPTTGKPAVSGNSGSGKDPNAPAPAPAVPGAVKGGTLTVLSVAGLNTMDPTEAYYTNTGSILSGLVIRSLTQYMYDPSTKQMVLVPDLATNLGVPSNHFKTWKFTLRSGIKFQNGQAVTPEDLKYGIERSFDRATFPGGANYSNQYFLHGDTYKGPYKSGTNYDGVTISGMTITIQMSKPFPDMPYWGAFPAMSPIPPGKASAPATYKNDPWATGPYKFGAYTPNTSLTLVRNPYWKASTDPARHNYINQFDFNFQDPSAKIDQTMLSDSGSGQTTISYDDVQASDYQQFSTQAGNRLVVGGLPCTFMWYPDNRQITSIQVRRALGWAFPYTAAWAAGGSIQGVTRIPATNVMPPGIPGRTVYNPLPGHTPGTTDAAKAHAILAAAGKLNYPIKFAYETDIPASVNTKNVEVQALQQAGFDPEPYATTSANYVADVLTNPKAPVNVRSVGWCSDWPSGSSWMPPEFQTTDIATSGFGSNYAAFSSKTVDNRINAIQLLPLAKQPAAWNALDKYIQDTYYPVVVTGYGGVAMMRGSKVMDMVDDTTYGMPYWKNMWLHP